MARRGTKSRARRGTPLPFCGRVHQQGSGRELRLCDESRKDIEQLTGLRKSLEGLDRARVQRLRLLASLKS